MPRYHLQILVDHIKNQIFPRFGGNFPAPIPTELKRLQLIKSVWLGIVLYTNCITVSARDIPSRGTVVTHIGSQQWT